VKPFVQTFLFISIIISFNQCKKETPPSVSSPNIKFVTAQGAYCQSCIISDGGAGIIERGFKWKKNTDPDYSDGKVAFANVYNSFETIILGLSPGTAYFVRAYATNSEGTSLSEYKMIETSGIGTFTDSRDGKTYKWVEIGNQTWMAENLSYLPYISPYTNDTGIFVYNYKDTLVEVAKNQSEFRKYGCLYSWEISKHVCPDGWHLPSDDEWQELEKYIGMSSRQISQYGEYDNTFPGNLLKSTDWSNPYGRSNSNNATLFTALPGGYHFHEQNYNWGNLVIRYFNDLGTSANFWSSTIIETDDLAYKVTLDYYGISRYVMEKNYGYSVRCVKDK
jgi:uncharacterized protein (TIGR02145 family)